MRNAELRRLRRPQLQKTRSFCSWMWCNCLFPEGRTNLDSIYGKFHFDVSHRCVYGVLLDSVIFAKLNKG